MYTRYYSNYSESIYVFLSFFLNIYRLKVWLQTKILCDLSVWSLAIPEICLAGPGGGEGSCPPRTDLVHCQGISSRTGASCSQGLRLRNLYSEVSMLKASAEALPRRFCQHLLIRGLGLSTFPHSDRVHLHAYLFPPFDPRSCKKAGSLFCRAPP